MNIEKFLTSEMVWLGEKSRTPVEIFESVAQKGLEKGYVNESFLEKITLREHDFPTGLQLDGYGVAIPHTDADCIERQFVSVVIPEESVPFKRMDDNAQEVRAQVVFVLGLNEPHSQLTMLQELMRLLQDKEVVTKLRGMKKAKEVVNYLTDLSKQTQL
jgi:PTS system galactitol-specific IIA component